MSGKVITLKRPAPKDDEPPREVWVVSGKLGPYFVASYREAAMEHAAELAESFPDEGPYRACKYVALPFS